MSYDPNNNYNNYNNDYTKNYDNNYKYSHDHIPEKKKSDWPYWVLFAIFMSGGLWWVGLVMLFIKLFGPDKSKSERREAPPLYEQADARRTSSSDYYRRNNPSKESRTKDTLKNLSATPSGSKKTTRVLMIIGGILAFIGFAMLEDVTGFASFMEAAGWMAGGGAMIFSGISLRKADLRYGRYLAVIGSNSAVQISVLAKKIGVSEKRCHKDLQKMIDKGYLGPTAYINEELGYVFASSEADDELQQNREKAMEKELAAKKAQKKEDAAKASDFYESTIARIRDLNDRISHEAMSEKIYKLENITREIFRTVENEPGKRSKIDKFLSYYLPTTLKLLESYAKLEATGFDGENIAQSMKSIESAMDSIVGGFEHQLDELYKTDVLDIETDIDVMTKMLSRDVPGSEFKLEQAPEDNRSQFEKDFNAVRNSDGTVTYGGSAAQFK